MRGEELPDALRLGLEPLQPGAVLRLVLCGSFSSSRARWAFIIVATAASILWASCRSSAYVPLRRLSALLGSFTPSIANICRPINPSRSQASSTCVKIGDTSSPSSLTKAAMVVNRGALSPEIAMNSTFSRHRRSIARLDTTPRL